MPSVNAVQRLLPFKLTDSESEAAEPNHDKNLDTHADDYNAQHGKTCSQSVVGELSTHARDTHLTKLIKL